jgi:hypothetical protein
MNTIPPLYIHPIIILYPKESHRSMHLNCIHIYSSNEQNQEHYCSACHNNECNINYFSKWQDVDDKTLGMKPTVRVECSITELN